MQEVFSEFAQDGNLRNTSCFSEEGSESSKWSSRIIFWNWIMCA
jgi:hypothetical protein